MGSMPEVDEDGWSELRFGVTKKNNLRLNNSNTYHQDNLLERDKNNLLSF